MYFDSLVHITEDGKWFNSKIDASYDRLLLECKQNNVTKLMLSGLPGIINNQYLLDAFSLQPELFVPIAGFDPTVYDCEKELTLALQKLSHDGFRGIKLHPRLNKYHPLDEKVKWAILNSVDYNLVVMFCTMWGNPMPMLEKPIWAIIDEICRININSKIIFVHGGYWDVLATSETIKNYENILIDLSYTFLRFKDVYRDRFEYLFSRFDRKICLGSDFPEYSITDVIEYFNTFHLNENKKENILIKNLQNFINIEK